MQFLNDGTLLCSTGMLVAVVAVVCFCFQFVLSRLVRISRYLKLI